MCGIWGTLSLGLFATGDFGISGPTGADLSTRVKGLFYGGGGKQLVAQVIGSLVICVATFGIASLVFYLVNLTGTLRVSEEGEIEGIDYHEHGGEAYHPEFGGPAGHVDITAVAAGMSGGFAEAAKSSV
jgi:Amt family ammonium transporter